MILVTELHCYFFIQKKDAPWGKTFDGFVKYAKEHPGQLKYVSMEVGSGHDLAVGWIQKKYGITVKKIPQGSHQECASSVGAGEADFSMIAGDVAYTNWQAGRIDVSLILAESLPAPFDKDPNVVSGKQIGLPSIVGTQLGLGVNSETPDSHVDWMYQLFYAASQKPEFQKRWQGMMPGDTPLPMKGPEVMKMMKQILVEFDQPVRDIGLHIDQQVPKDRAVGEPGIPSTYVPARNTVLLSLALAWAEALGATDIFIGVNAVDYSGYPDCRPAFIEAFERMASLATKAGVEGAGFTIHAPLIAMTQGEIIRRGLALGVDYGLTRSCYDPGPGGAPCGRCDSCALRARGFAEAGVPDPGAEDPGLHRVGAPTLPGGAEGKAGP